MMVTVAAAAALIIQEIQKIKMWGEEKKKQTSQTAGPYFNQMIEDSKMY